MDPKTREQAEPASERPTVPAQVDIFENREEILLLADLPGVEEKDLHLHLDDKHITLEGRVAEGQRGAPLSQEWTAIDYRRSFLLPPGIDRARITAELRAGVLTLHLPKSEAIKPRKIPVQAG
jgi:HSP20 family protein